MTIQSQIRNPSPAADQRTHDILDSIRQTFAVKGFDGASMQDLARAASMSVGNFYRYFPSKSAIIEALVTRDLLEIEQAFAEIRRSDDPIKGLHHLIEHRLASGCNGEDGQLWAEITAAAFRKPEVGEISRRMEDSIVHNVTAIFADVRGIPHEVSCMRYTSHARLLVMLVKSGIMMASAERRDDPVYRALLMRTVDRTINEILDDEMKV